MVPDEREVDEPLLTETGRGGLFGSGYLADRPLATYLERDEEVQVVFTSGGHGVVHLRGETERAYSPASGYRAIVALTDRRVVIGVGGGGNDGSDQVRKLPLETIEHVEIARSSGSEVRVWTGAEEFWLLTPRGVDIEDVVSEFRTASQSWNRFERLLEDVRAALTDAARQRADSDFEGAASTLDRAKRLLEDAEATAEAFDASSSEMRDRLDRTLDRYRSEQRRLVLARATLHRKQARNRWYAENYEAAADQFERARDIYEGVLDLGDLTDATRSELQDELGTVKRDLDRLSRTPLQCALAVQRAAERADDPHDALERWQAAFERYRDVLELDWGRDQPRFAGEKSDIRDRLETAIAGILIARQRAADQHSHIATRHQDDGEYEDARSEYVEARRHLSAAIETAAEYAPAERESLTERLTEIEANLEDLPTEEPRPESFLENQPDHADSDAGTTISSKGTAADPEVAIPAVHAREESREAYVRHLQTLDDGQAVLAVGVVWRELGWTIELVEESAADVIATHPERERPLALSVRRRGVPLTATEVESLADTCGNRADDPSPVLVTTDPVEATAFETAMALGVTLVDSLRLGELARVTGVQPTAVDESLQQ